MINIYIQPYQVFITLVVIVGLIAGFWLFHIVLPERAERRRLQRKLNSYPKPGLVVDAKLSGEFEERRMRALNDTGIHADDFASQVLSELEVQEG